MTFDKMNTDITFPRNAQNRLTSVTSMEAPSASVSQTSAIRALTYDSAWNLLTERTLDGKQVGEYIHGLRTDEILRAELTPQTQNPKSQTLYPLADGLGSTVALTDDKGKVTERYRYTAYGTPTALRSDYALSATGSSLLNYRFLFTGREWLGSVGLNDHRNRYCSPSLGRWLTTDPITFLGRDINLYRYVVGRITANIDPYGLKERPRYSPDAPPYAHPNTATPGGPNSSCTNHEAYNCHTYAWHNGEPDSTDPLYDPNFPLWDDSPINEMAGATPLSDDAPNQIGDRIEYYDAEGHVTHSGIVTAVDGDGNALRITSKWGGDSIYDHFPSDVPSSYGSTRRYYRLPEASPAEGGDQCTLDCDEECP